MAFGPFTNTIKIYAVIRTWIVVAMAAAATFTNTIKIYAVILGALFGLTSPLISFH